MSESKLYKFKEDFIWSSVETKSYKDKANHWRGVVRRVLIGDNGETAKFHLRYFEIAPNGFSSYEKHKHEHVVICVRGSGEVYLDNANHTISFLDTVYVAPNTSHQFINRSDEPFGFFCIVDAKRDKPVLLKKNKK